MIYFFTPWSFEKDLGDAYNHYCSLIPNPDDWICVTDHDTLFLLPTTIPRIKKYIELYPNTGIFTCYTNRVGSKKQCYGHELSENPNILYHRDIAKKLEDTQEFNIAHIAGTISGFLMVFKKSTWEYLRFRNGILKVDTDFSIKALRHNFTISLMKSVYVFHYYRLSEGRNHLQHLLN
jgi:GT2 family glycosyltransferase